MQVVYAGAFITRVGQKSRESGQNESRVALYQKIGDLTLQHLKLETEKQNLVEAQSNLKSNDLDAMRSL